jgi:hypothetical protein
MQIAVMAMSKKVNGGLRDLQKSFSFLIGHYLRILNISFSELESVERDQIDSP